MDVICSTYNFLVSKSHIPSCEMGRERREGLHSRSVSQLRVPLHQRSCLALSLVLRILHVLQLPPGSFQLHFHRLERYWCEITAEFHSVLSWKQMTSWNIASKGNLPILQEIWTNVPNLAYNHDFANSEVLQCLFPKYL